jgi:hypothetical protein
VGDEPVSDRAVGVPLGPASAEEYSAPLGPLCNLAERLVLHRYMPHLLQKRNAWLTTTLER